MGKPLINIKQWTRNDGRMLVIVLFTLVYPILAGSLFMVLQFFVLPKGGMVNFWSRDRISASHAYWLIASGAWALLLTIILPLMRDRHEYQPTGSHDYNPTGPEKEPKNKAKEHSSTEKIPPVHVKVEAAKMDNVNRDSILTNRSSYKSDDNSSNSIEKGTLEETADKENLEKKSLESIPINDYTLNKRKSMMHSGEFLNDCIGNIGDDNKKQNDDDVLEDDNKKLNDDDVCKDDNKKQNDDEVLEDDNKKEVNADMHKQNDAMNAKEKDSTDKESKDDDSDIEMINETQDMNGKIEEDKSNKIKPDAANNNKTNTDDIESQVHATEVVTPISSNVIDKQLTQDAITDDEDEELGEIATPPPMASLDRRESNVVHLFVQGQK